MIELNRILVPTDLSDHSMAALEHAESIAERFAGRVFVLHVADARPVVPGVRDPRREQRAEDAGRGLEAWMRRRTPSPGHCIPVVRTGNPPVEICRFAEEERIDLVVMSTHGRTGLRHIVMGSVAETVVHLSAVPVLTINPARLRESVIRNEDIEHELHLR